MSVQFGRWNFGGQPPAPDYIEKVCAVLAPYGPDSNERYDKGGVKILYRAFHTTEESHREVQPHIFESLQDAQALHSQIQAQLNA